MKKSYIAKYPPDKNFRVLLKIPLFITIYFVYGQVKPFLPLIDKISVRTF